MEYPIKTCPRCKARLQQADGAFQLVSKGAGSPEPSPGLPVTVYSCPECGYIELCCVSSRLISSILISCFSSGTFPFSSILHLQLFVLTEVASLSATHGGRTSVSTLVIIISFGGNPYHPWLKSSAIGAAIVGSPEYRKCSGGD